MRIKINDSYYVFFNDLSISLKLDSVASTFSFNAKFNPENENHRKLLKPLSFYKVEIYNSNDDLILTGTILNHKFTSNSGINLVSVSGYSLGGILEDCTIPVSNWPLENINRSLKDIASRLCGIFNLKLIIDQTALNDSNLIYKKSVANVTDSVKSYLSKLTSQRNVVLGHNNKGDIVLFKLTQKKPVLSLNKESSLSMSLGVNGQGMNSLISVVRQPSEENSGVSTLDSIKNNLIIKERPVTKVLSSGEDTDTSKAADNELSSQLKNISLSISINELIDALNVGDFIEVQNDEIFIYNKTLFVISQLDFNVNVSGENTNITLVLPEVYLNGSPKNIF